MKTYLLILILAINATGCMKPTLAGWQGNQFTLCCKNKFCSAETLKEQAEKQCSGEVTLLGQHQSKGNGALSLGNGVYGVATNQCSVFECSGTFNK